MQRGGAGTHDHGLDPKPLATTDPERIGRWTPRARLGAGAMGVVFLAEGDGQFVALKVVRPELLEDIAFRARFRREIAALRRITSPYVTRVVDADAEADAPWLATELVDGPSLADAVVRGGPVTVDRLLVVARGLAEALVAIHDAGVVHRDLKPGNVLLAWDRPRVVDFGIAYAAEGGPTSLTAIGSAIGSPGFTAPEQATGQPVTPAADVFAWACTVVFAGMGDGPFGRGSADEVLYRVVHEPARVPAVPEPLRSLVVAALHKDPARRPSARDICNALVADAVPPTIGARPPYAATGPAPMGRRDRRRDIALASSAVAIVVFAAVVIALGFRSSGASPRASTSPPRPSSSVASSSTTQPPVRQLALADTDYGFKAPATWDSGPLSDDEERALSTATFSDAGGKGSMIYAISGESDGVYDFDGSVDLQGALNQACLDTRVQGSHVVGSHTIGYACTPSDPGTEINGLVIVDPNRSLFTWKKLEVTLPPALHETATAILDTFTLAGTACPCPLG